MAHVSILKKSWGIMLWGIFFIVLGWGIFNLQVYYQRGFQGRARALSYDIADYNAKLKQAHSAVTNVELQKQLPQIERTFYSNLNNFENALIFAGSMKNVLYFPIMGTICILTGVGLIFRREIARKLVRVLSIILTIGNLYLVYIVIHMSQQAVPLINAMSGLECFLKNTSPITLCNSYYYPVNLLQSNLIFYLQIATPLILFSTLVIWYFSRPKIKEQFR